MVRRVLGSITVAFSTLLLIAAARAGDGIGGVDVGIRKKPGMQQIASQRTAKDGSFAFTNLSAGSYVLTVNVPNASNPAAKSYFESRSNMVLRIEDPAHVGGDEVTFDLAVKGGAFFPARKKNDIAMNAIGNIKARQSEENPNEISIEILNGQQIRGRLTLAAAMNAAPR